MDFQKLNDKEKFRVKNLYNLYSVFSTPTLQMPASPHKHWPCGYLQAWNYKIFIKFCTCTFVVHFYVDTYIKLLYNKKLCIHIRKRPPVPGIPQRDGAYAPAVAVFFHMPIGRATSPIHALSTRRLSSPAYVGERACTAKIRAPGRHARQGY